MKSISNKIITKNQQGEYASINELVEAKLKRATQTLKNVDFSKVMKSN
jgi:flavin-binding protein dodecin